MVDTTSVFMSTGNPIDDLIKSFDDLARSADNFWKEILRNNYATAELIRALSVEAIFANVKLSTRVWLQNEYYRSLRERNQDQSS